MGGKTLAFTVKERQDVNPEEMKKGLDPLRTEMVNQKRDQYFGAYIQEVRKKMTDEKRISINEASLTQISSTIG
jgi:hypothetical protein